MTEGKLLVGLLILATLVFVLAGDAMTFHARSNPDAVCKELPMEPNFVEVNFLAPQTVLMFLGQFFGYMAAVMQIMFSPSCTGFIPQLTLIFLIPVGLGIAYILGTLIRSSA